MPTENRDMFIDLKTVTIPRERVPASATVRGSYSDGEVPIAALRFRYKGDDDSKRVTTEGWNLVREALEKRVAELSSEGWRLTKPLDVEMTQAKTGDNTNLILILVVLGMVTFFVTWLIALFIWVAGRGYWVQYRSAALPMSRYVADMAQ